VAAAHFLNKRELDRRAQQGTSVLKGLVTKAPSYDPLERAALTRADSVLADLGRGGDIFGVDLARLRATYRDLEANYYLPVDIVPRLGLPIDPWELSMEALRRIQGHLSPVDLAPRTPGIAKVLYPPERDIYVELLTHALAERGVELVAYGTGPRGELVGLVHQQEARLRRTPKMQGAVEVSSPAKQGSWWQRMGRSLGAAAKHPLTAEVARGLARNATVDVRVDVNRRR
jgi:hypothetical protein